MKKTGTDVKTNKKSKVRKISRQKVWQALRWELPNKQLWEVYKEQPYPKDRYFDLELMLDKIHRYMNGEVEWGYFHDWCLVLMNCLLNYTSCRSSKIHNIVYAAGMYFDGVAFDGQTPKECRELIANLKWDNHQIENASKRRDENFVKNGVCVYVDLGYYIEGSDTELYSVLIADTVEKKFNIIYVENIDYDENINFSFDDSWGCLPEVVNERFSDYRLDSSLNLDYYKLKSN